MMIVMKAGATEAEIESVIRRIESVGARAHPSRGEEVTAIGAIGDREHVGPRARGGGLARAPARPRAPAPARARGSPRRPPVRTSPQAVQARLDAGASRAVDGHRRRRTKDR